MLVICTQVSSKLAERLFSEDMASSSKPEIKNDSDDSDDNDSDSDNEDKGYELETHIYIYII